MAGLAACPCLTAASLLFSSLNTSLINLGYPADYGLKGCEAYDNERRVPDSDCADNSQPWCAQTWCYVDPALCGLNEEMCRARGEKVGSAKSPYCRSVPHEQSWILTGDQKALFSYETCGNLQQYDTALITKPCNDITLLAAVDAYAPWVASEPEESPPYGGAIFDFMMTIKVNYMPQIELTIQPGWATAPSRELFSSTYTACVHDVAVGNFDLCIADLWMTASRVQMAHFLPVIREDNFDLVVPIKKGGSNPFYTEEMPVASIPDMATAIKEKIKICVPGVIHDAMSLNYPDATWVTIGYAEEGPRNIYAGNCGATVMSETNVLSLHAGSMARTDCKAVEDGSLTEAQGRCKKGLGGSARDDCELFLVGEALLSVPVAMPVSARLAHSLSWSTTKELLKGMFEKQVLDNAQHFPQSKCKFVTTPARLNTLALVLIGVVCFLLIAVVVAVCMYQQSQKPDGKDGGQELVSEI